MLDRSTSPLSAHDVPDERTAVKQHRYLALSALLTAVCVLGGCSGESTPQETRAETRTVPSGTRGAAHLDDGYVQIGSGPKVVDLFVDPLCPFCKMFEESSGQMLFAEAGAGRATLRVHPLATLNRLSQGTDYSTRASAMLVAVAATSPDRAQDYLAALYAQQPAENTSGLTTTQLQQIATRVGASPISDTDAAGYRSWVDAHTQQAVAGPLVATDEIATITQVPTIIVNRSVFTGDSDETAAFAAFYRDH